MSSRDKNCVPCLMRFSCPAQGEMVEKIILYEKINVKMFAVAGCHADVCDAFI